MTLIAAGMFQGFSNQAGATLIRYWIRHPRRFWAQNEFIWTYWSQESDQSQNELSPIVKVIWERLDAVKTDLGSEYPFFWKWKPILCVRHIRFLVAFRRQQNCTSTHLNGNDGKLFARFRSLIICIWKSYCAVCSRTSCRMVTDTCNRRTTNNSCMGSIWPDQQNFQYPFHFRWLWSSSEHIPQW